MVIRVLSVVALIIAILAASVQPVCAQSREELDSVRMVAKCLDRMGEKKIAKRLLSDYFAKEPKVKVQDIGEAGVAAETGPDDIMGSGPNYITLDDNIIAEVGGQKALVDKTGRTYHTSTSTLSWAETVYHEYIHMDQKNPDEVPKFEDKAWQKSNEAIVKWYNNLDKEFQKIKKEKPSEAKGKKLQELNDLMYQFQGLFTTQYEAIDTKITEGRVSKGLRWKAPGFTSKDIGMVGKRAKSSVMNEIMLIEKEIKNNKDALKAPTPTEIPAGQGGDVFSDPNYDWGPAVPKGDTHY